MDADKAALPARAPRLAIIMPTLNERDNIQPLVDRIAQSIDFPEWEAIFVDDNSSDGTADEVRRVSRRNPRVRVIQRIGRSGLASAVIEGACSTSATYIAVMDADHQHDPVLINAMVKAIEKGEADVCVASRFIDGASAGGLSSQAREKGSRFANKVTACLTGAKMTDPMSGYFAMKADTFRSLAPNLSGIGFKILLDLLACAKPRLRVKEFPLTFTKRLHGDSKLDRAVIFEFMVGLYERLFGKIIPTRFALFGTVGALGVIIHMAILGLLYQAMGETFVSASFVAVLGAMSFNFWLNNFLTYNDKRLSGFLPLAKGWVKFCLTCAIGGLANVGIAAFLLQNGIHWIASALAGIAIGSVWNYALSSRFVWGRYR